MGKGENTGYQHFSPFPTLFSKGFCFKVVKSLDCVVELRDIVRKGKYIDDQHFLLFLHYTSYFPMTKSIIYDAFESSLTFSQTTNVRLFQTERVCRRQFQNG